MEAIIRQTKFVQKINSSSRKEEIIKILKGLQTLREQGQNNDEILEVIQSLELPLGIHLFITGNFSDLLSIKFK